MADGAGVTIDQATEVDPFATLMQDLNKFNTNRSEDYEGSIEDPIEEVSFAKPRYHVMYISPNLVFTVKFVE